MGTIPGIALYVANPVAALIGLLIRDGFFGGTVVLDNDYYLDDKFRNCTLT